MIRTIVIPLGHSTIYVVISGSVRISVVTCGHGKIVCHIS